MGLHHDWSSVCTGEKRSTSYVLQILQVQTLESTEKLLLLGQEEKLSTTTNLVFPRSILLFDCTKSTGHLLDQKLGDVEQHLNQDRHLHETVRDNLQHLLHYLTIQDLVVEKPEVVCQLTDAQRKIVHSLFILKCDFSKILLKLFCIRLTYPLQSHPNRLHGLPSFLHCFFHRQKGEHLLQDSMQNHWQCQPVVLEINVTELHCFPQFLCMKVDAHHERPLRVVGLR